MRDVAETIGIDELHDHTTRYLAMVRDGKRIGLTQDGELVAYIEPARAPNTYARMKAAGLVRPATGRGIGTVMDDIPPPEPGEGSLFDELMKMRDEERY